MVLVNHFNVKFTVYENEGDSCISQEITSNFLTNSFAVGAETMIWRALGLMKPSSTALSMNDSKEL